MPPKVCVIYRRYEARLIAGIGHCTSMPDATTGDFRATRDWDRRATGLHGGAARRLSVERARGGPRGTRAGACRKRGVNRPPAVCYPASQVPLGDRLAVGHRTLTPRALVRIQVPQPFLSIKSMRYRPCRQPVPATVFCCNAQTLELRRFFVHVGKFSTSLSPGKAAKFNALTHHLERAPRAGRHRAASLTGGRAWCPSCCSGLS